MFNMSTIQGEQGWLASFVAGQADRLLSEAGAIAKLEQAAAAVRGGWPAYGVTIHPVTGYRAEGVPLYVSKRSGKVWSARNEEERRAVLEDRPRFVLLRGGEGSGKSAGAVIKTLERLRRGMEWIFASPDFEHFKTSAWPLLREWCPDEVVDRSDRHMMSESWEATRKFELHVVSESGKTVGLKCMGIDDPHSVRGGNVTGATFDEASRHQTAAAFKFLAGRVRIQGPKGEPPQMILSTTPEMNWLYEYFGPVKEDEADPYERFKRSCLNVVLKTEENITNLDPDYVEERSSVLTEAEKRVYMGGEWEDLSAGSPFLETMQWWDECREMMPEYSKDDPLILAADGAVSNDTFGLIGVGKHPSRDRCLAVQLVQAWVPEKGRRKLDFDEIEEEIAEKFCKQYNVLKIVYDPKDLHQMMTGLRKRRVVHTEEFSQGTMREIADKGLLDLIQQRRIAHDGDVRLRSHVSNADRKLTPTGGLRIVKRTDPKKIDLCVALSMACHKAGRLFNAKPAIPSTSVARRF